MEEQDQRTKEYQRITQRILAAVKNDRRRWRRPWCLVINRPSPKRIDGTTFQGANRARLLKVIEADWYVSDFWLTLQEATQLDGRMIEGQQGTRLGDKGERFC